MCLNQVRIWSLSPHRSFLEKVQGVLLITGITVKVCTRGWDMHRSSPLEKQHIAFFTSQ